MIVYYNVCQYCGTQTQIDLEEKNQNKGFEFCFYTTDLVSCVEDKRFGKQQKYKSATFCDKECLLNFLKENLTETGELKNETE